MLDFDEIVDEIYEAATEPERWPTALHKVSASTGCAGGIILLRRSSHWVGWRCSEGLAKGAKQFMESDALARSQTTSRLIKFDRAGFVTDTDIFSESEYRADPLVTEWAAPNSLFHGAATAINTPSKDLIVVQVQRADGRSAFSSSDVERLDAFRPHLARAGLLAVRFQFERFYAAAQALEMVGLPAAILDPSGAVICANNLIQALTHHVSWTSGNRIALSDRGADLMLREGVVLSGRERNSGGRSFPIRKKGKRGPAIVHLIPITRSAQDLFEGGITVMIITPLTTGPAIDAGMLQGLFDLTPAESKVASSIGSGLTLGEIAKARGCSLETVRTQVKSVFAKTNTSRQSEIASLLARLPKIQV